MFPVAIIQSGFNTYVRARSAASMAVKTSQNAFDTYLSHKTIADLLLWDDI